MELVDIYNEDARDTVRYLTEDRNKIEGIAKGLISRLARVCSAETLADRWATKLTIQEDGTSAFIDSPFGHAWAELTLGIEDGKVLGFWNIWKRVVDDEGEKSSSLAATVRFTSRGLALLGKSDQKGLSVYEGQGSQEDVTAHHVMSAILYAIGAH